MSLDTALDPAQGGPPEPLAAPPSDGAEAEALVGRLFEALLGSLELGTVHLGVKLGFYDALTVPRTYPELAAATGILPRYAQEWCEQQAIAGLVRVDGATDPEQRRFWLDKTLTAVLQDTDSPTYAGSMALLSGGCGAVQPAVVEAWRNGTGLSFGEYGDDVRAGQGMFNKPGYLGQLVEEWLPAMPEVEALLQLRAPRVLDVGCGVGWSSIALARAIPGVEILGVDSDEASIVDARRNAQEADLADRVRFEVASSEDPLPSESVDVAFYFECLHDMAHPVPALAATRRALRPGGRVVVMDERAEEEFAPDGPPMERLLGAASVLHCLPVGLSEPDSAGTGTLMRPATLRRYAAEAGYRGVEVAPIEHEMMRFYVLTP